ncbi:MAG TPA: PIG-L family deacetylase [Nitrolancea sp.]|jgi:LmbE family N-acetylglucosaminyl deacetylase|nr:PIG-L family deacetylase [Nitrolancea sp.]
MAALDSTTIVAVFAHPDDEVMGSGGTLAKHAEHGRVVAICATRGELGEISDPSLATPENLGEVRERELLDAYAVLGINDVRFLDYRDSGMAGTEGNNDPSAFMNADPEEAVAKIVKVLREVGPAVVITFEKTGGYGHPDHLAVHRFTTDAFQAASDPNSYPELGEAIAPGRLVYAGFPRSLMKAMFGRAKDAGEDVGFFSELDIDQLGLPDDALDFVLNVREMADRKLAAMRTHRTQFQEGGLVSRIPEEVREDFVSHEYFQFGGGVPFDGDRPGNDLFA